MSELAIIPRFSPSDSHVEHVEPIAEQNFTRRQLQVLEQNLGKLQKSARDQKDVVSQLDTSLKTMISETDLRRAIGLAFQEFELRLEDAFQESSRKSVAMFSRREDVTDLQGQIGKKVNWLEYNAVLKKVAELRQYLDTMANDIFIGHREALNGEFTKKADKVMVEDALKAKADFTDVNEVRARLERLEVLVATTDAKHSATLQHSREETEEKRRAMLEQLNGRIAANATGVASLREEHRASVERLGAAEGHISTLTGRADKLHEVQAVIRKQQEEVVMVTLASLRDQLQAVDTDSKQMLQNLQALDGDVKEFRSTSEQRFTDLTTQAKACREHLDFLMQATEMIKRRSREQGKSNAASFKELEDAQTQLREQLAALERVMKKNEREVRAVERTHRALSCDAAAAPTQQLALPAPTDPNDRLKGVLEQLERIAGDPGLEPPLGNPLRPGLPFSAKGAAATALEQDLATLSRFAGANGPAPIDSARGGAQSARAYDASPRGVSRGPARGGRRK